jgi:hypothetical protein
MSILGPDFNAGRALISIGGQPMVRWLDAVERAPDGTDFEVGLDWDPERRWCVYQRIGAEKLVMSSDQARKIARIYNKMCKKLDGRDIGEGMKDTLGALEGLAREAYRKNQAGEIPEGALGLMPAEGSA